MASEPKLWNRWFTTCVLCNFFYCTAFYMSTPILTTHLMNMGEGAALAGFIAGIFSILALLFRPFAGFAADRTNRKNMVMLGLVFYSIAFTGYGFSPNAYWVLFFRIIHALGLCSLTTALTVVATHFVPEGRTAEGIGYVTMGNALATALGPAVGVFCMELFGCQTSFFASGAVVLVALALTAPMPPVNAPASPKGKKQLGLSSFICVEALPLTLCVCGFGFCAGMTTSFFVATGTARAIAGVSLFFVVSSLGAIATRPFAGRIVDQKGLKPVISVSLICEAVCMIAAAFASSIVGVIIAGLGRTGGQLVGQSSLQGQVMRDIPDENRGVASSTFYMGVDVGQGMGAMLGGVIAGAFGYTSMYLSGLVALVIATATFMWYLKKRAQ